MVHELWITGSVGDFSHRAERFLSSGSEVTLYSNEVRDSEGGVSGEGERSGVRAELSVADYGKRW